MKTATGVEFLLEHLRAKRGKQQVDLLGDALEKYFQLGDAMRKDGESLNDFEKRHAVCVRDIAKAMAEVGSEKVSVPTEIYGWYVINRLMKLDHSEVAMVKAKASSYKLDDVLGALRKMWGGESLSHRDKEHQKGSSHRAYVNVTSYEDDTTCSPSVLMNEADYEDDLAAEEEQVEDSYVMYEDALNAMMSSPEDETCWANFQDAKKMFYKDARKALDRNRVNRGFYPNSKGTGKGKGSLSTSRSAGNGETFDGHCIRCAKYGHKAEFCKHMVNPKNSASSSSDKGSRSGVGFVFGVLDTVNSGMGEMEIASTEGKIDQTSGMRETTAPVDATKVQPIFATLKEQAHACAILDSGASESVVGVCTLQDVCDHLNKLGFNPQDEVHIDRDTSREFIFGNNQSAHSLGVAEVNAGLAGKELALQAHLVEGPTPLLLSSKWLHDHAAVIDFQSGQARFDFTDGKTIQLQRTQTHHLLLPIDAFMGNAEVLTQMQIESRILRLIRSVHFGVCGNQSTSTDQP